MASKVFFAFGSSRSAGLFLTLNLLFSAFTSACGTTSTSPSRKPCGSGKRPIDTLKLAACASVLNSLNTVAVGKFLKQPCECCTLIDGVIDLKDTVRLCTALKANVLGIHLNPPINLSLLPNYRSKKAPSEFHTSSRQSVPVVLVCFLFLSCFVEQLL